MKQLLSRSTCSGEACSCSLCPIRVALFAPRKQPLCGLTALFHLLQINSWSMCSVVGLRSLGQQLLHVLQLSSSMLRGRNCTMCSSPSAPGVSCSLCPRWVAPCDPRKQLLHCLRSICSGGAALHMLQWNCSMCYQKPAARWCSAPSLCVYCHRIYNWTICCDTAVNSVIILCKLSCCHLWQIQCNNSNSNRNNNNNNNNNNNTVHKYINKSEAETRKMFWLVV